MAAPFRHLLAPGAYGDGLLLTEAIYSGEGTRLLVDADHLEWNDSFHFVNELAGGLPAIAYAHGDIMAWQILRDTVLSYHIPISEYMLQSMFFADKHWYVEIGGYYISRHIREYEVYFFDIVYYITAWTMVIHCIPCSLALIEFARGIVYITAEIELTHFFADRYKVVYES